MKLELVSMVELLVYFKQPVCLPQKIQSNTKKGELNLQRYTTITTQSQIHIKHVSTTVTCFETVHMSFYKNAFLKPAAEEQRSASHEYTTLTSRKPHFLKYLVYMQFTV